MSNQGVDPVACYQAGLRAGLRRGREQGYREAMRQMTRLNTDANDRRTLRLLKAWRDIELEEFDSSQPSVYWSSDDPVLAAARDFSDDAARESAELKAELESAYWKSAT